jgi:hypothetical protein
MIRITRRGWQHILKHHTGPQQQGRRNKSTFHPKENLVQLIRQAAGHVPVRIQRGKQARVFDAGHDVGIDRRSGVATAIVTVVTLCNGDLVTMFPGSP